MSIKSKTNDPLKHQQEKHLFKDYVEHGVYLRSLTTKHFPLTGRGMVTKRQIDVGDMIISIPKNLLITFDTILNSYLAPYIKNKQNNTMTSMDYFIIFLLVEKWFVHNSKWRSFLECLPKTFTTPSYINKKLINILPPFVRDAFLKQTKEISHHYKAARLILQKIFPASRIDITFDYVRWAWNVINTRSVYFDPCNLLCHQDITNIVGKKDFALAPVLDMLNHNDQANIEVKFNKNNQCYEIKTFDEYDSSTQVFINYGPHSNRTLFVDYGFFIEDNIHQSIPISETILIDVLDFDKDNLEYKNLISNLKCTQDGLDWNFYILCHLLINKEKISYSSLPTPCNAIECCAYSKAKTMLQMLIKERELYMEKIKSFLSECNVISIIYFLLQSELRLINTVLSDLSSECLLLSA